MSVFPDDMGHFVRWLERHLPGSTAATYAPRMLYGNYLADIFDQTLIPQTRLIIFLLLPLAWLVKKILGDPSG